MAEQDKEKSDKKPTDWEAVERDYRAGVLSLRQMGDVHNVSHVAIKKRADKEGWTRDLSAKIRAKAQEKVNRAAVTTEVNAVTKATEQEVIEANAEVITNIVLTHRKDIRAARELTVQMMEELRIQTGNLDLFEQLGEIMFSPDENGKDRLNEIYRRVISLGGRVDNLKKLSDTLKTLIDKEREAFGVDKGEHEDKEGALRALLREHAPK